MKASKYTASQHMERAELAMQKQDVDTARECLHEAAELSPQDAEVLNAYGAVLAEHGPSATAVDVLKRAVEVEPDTGHAKFMYLGQLLDGPDSISNFEHGIRVLRSLPSDKGGERDEILAEALCSLSEAHLSDKSAEDVGADVESLLNEAVLLSKASHPEPLQVLASLRVEQGKPDEAMAFLQQSMALWYDDQPLSDADARPETRQSPSYEFRLETVKLLLELDETINTAYDVLHDLVEEDDRVVEAWYLLSIATLAGDEFEEAADAVDRGLALCKGLGMPKDDPMWLAFEGTKADIHQAEALQNGQSS